MINVSYEFRVKFETSMISSATYFNNIILPFFMRSNKSSPGSNSPIRPNFKFNLEVRPSEEYKTGVLIATATDRLDLPIPVRC